MHIFHSSSSNKCLHSLQLQLTFHNGLKNSRQMPIKYILAPNIFQIRAQAASSMIFSIVILPFFSCFSSGER